MISVAMKWPTALCTINDTGHTVFLIARSAKAFIITAHTILSLWGGMRLWMAIYAKESAPLLHVQAMSG